MGRKTPPPKKKKLVKTANQVGSPGVESQAETELMWKQVLSRKRVCNA